MAQVDFRTGVIRPIEVYKEAWELIKDQYWLIFGITLVGMMIGGAIPVVLMGPMMCGTYVLYFAKLAGRPIEISQLFKGFDHFVPSLLVAVLIMVPTFLLIFAIYIPMFVMMMAAPRMDESEVMAVIAGYVAVELVVAVIMVCIHTLLLFAFPLIVDKRLSAVESVKVSARAVWANLSGVVGLFAVGFVVCLLGFIALCFGIYLVLPLVIGSTVVAYKKVFPFEGELA